MLVKMDTTILRPFNFIIFCVEKILQFYMLYLKILN